MNMTNDKCHNNPLIESLRFRSNTKLICGRCKSRKMVVEELKIVVCHITTSVGRYI
ncbi:MAG: hypothetical protein LBM93_09980 [Oscillospiraceae bacterium]|nr:hypothetical protein [Oscillospiraceae bacterium]